MIEGNGNCVPEVDMDPERAFDLLRGKGQPFLVVVQAVEIAASPDIVRDLIRYTVYGERPPSPLPPRPPMREWITMYRCHRSMQDRIGEGMGLSIENSASCELDELRAVSQLSHEEITAEVAEASHEEQVDFLRLFMGVPFPPDDATIQAMLDGIDKNATPDDPDEEAMTDMLMASPAGQFFMRVWWPCWILYREYPPRLLRSARLGNMDSLDRLLRLDKRAIADPRVAQLVADIMSNGNPSQRKQLKAALDGKVKKKLTDKAMRAGLGALISQLALLFKTQVTAPQIEELFNRIERIRTGNLVDPAVPTGETWSKAIQRNKDWPSLPTDHPDSK